MSVVVGIDLGTTYSSIAVYRNGSVEVIPIEDGTNNMPSWVTFTDTERLVGQSAKDKAVLHPDNTIFDVKRYLGRTYDDRELQKYLLTYPYQIINVNNQPMIEVLYKNETKRFAPEEISAIILEKLKSLAESYLNCPVTKAVITVPAHFTNSQREATVIAGRIAGLEVQRIINEPTAASLAYGIHRKYKEMQGPHTILIYDFGGGTFDVSIITIDNGVFEVKATNGEPYLGGDDIDVNLMKYFIEKFKKQYKINLHKDKRAMTRLLHQCEKLKKDFANTDGEPSGISIDGIVINGNKSYDLEYSLDTKTFYKLNQKLFDKTIHCVKKALKEANIRKEHIDDIILIGGSSRLSQVKNIIRDFFKKEPSVSLNADEAVAIGAAIQGAILNGETSESDLSLLLYDINPLSLGIAIRGGEMSVIIPKNTPIPTQNIQAYETWENEIDEIPITIYEGESTLIKRNRKLGEFLIKIPPKRRGEILIDVCFEINVDGILNVTATLTDGEHTEDLCIDIKKTHLSEKEIQRLIDEAARHREEDELSRKTAEAKYKLQERLMDFNDTIEDDDIQNSEIEYFTNIIDGIMKREDKNDVECEDAVKNENNERITRF